MEEPRGPVCMQIIWGQTACNFQHSAFKVYSLLYVKDRREYERWIVIENNALAMNPY